MPGSFPAPGGGSPQQITVLLPVGDTIYGMIAMTGGSFSGRDVPFAYNLTTQTFANITFPQGPLACPVTQPTGGDTVQPIMAVVANRVIITHPGYTGAIYKFGWLDISGFVDQSVSGNTTNSEQIIALTKNVLQSGWQPGLLIAGANIPANTVIASISVSALDLNTTCTTDGTFVLSNVANTVGLVVGSVATGLNIVPGSIVESIVGSSVTLNTATTGMATNGGVNFSGGTSLIMSNSAVGSTVGEPLTVTGGTAAAPIYAAGDTNINKLPSIPVSVAEFYGRANFAVNNEVVQSDSLIPCQITNASQAIEFANGLPVTALSGTPLNQTTGGVLSALLAFQGDNGIQQITGDSALGTLQVNAVASAAGTNSPLTLAQTPLGLMFISPEGLRLLDFNGNVSPPIGSDGEGVCVPFLNAEFPTRMCAAYNEDVYRVTCKNIQAGVLQEWWFHLKLKAWSGPHTSTNTLIAALQTISQHGFVMAPTAATAVLWTGSTIARYGDSYIENGQTLLWVRQTALFPDNGQMSENRIGQSMISIALPVNQNIVVTAEDEQSNQLGQVTLAGIGTAGYTWGAPTIWGPPTTWGAGATPYLERPLSWAASLVFKQMTMTIAGQSATGLVLGSERHRLQPLGYLSQQLS